MTSRSLGTLALKVWGVTILISAVTILPAALAMLKTMSGSDPQTAMMRTSEVVAIVNLVFRAVVGAAIVVWSERIVSFMVAEEPPLDINISMAEIVPLTFGVVGIFVLVDGLQNVAGVVYALYAKPQFIESTASYVWERQYEAIVRAVPQVAAGVLLIAGRGAIARWWLRLRGIDSDADVDEHDEDGDEDSK
jgi:hypothetical protein